MKKIIGLILVLTLIATVFSISASALIVGDWEITISDGEATIIDYTGTCTETMVLPTQIGNYKVVAIEDKSDYDSKDIFDKTVKEVIIPEGYRAVLGCVFHGLSKTLEKVTLPESLEEFTTSFNSFTALKEISIPGKVKTLQHMQFARCTALEHVYLHEGLEYIQGAAFQYCTNLKEIKIPNTVKKIDREAFSNCSSLTELVIPDSVTELGLASDTVHCNSVITNCENLETVVIGDGVKILGGGELSGCPNLKSVYVGTSVKEIYDYNAFAGDPQIKLATFAEGLEYIGGAFFYNSVNLEAIVLPKSIKTIQTFRTLLNENSPLPKLFIYGYGGSKVQEFANQQGIPFVDVSVATPTSSRLLINGSEVAFTAYNIGDNNYFKIRDIACAINGTEKNFGVGWDGENNAISLTRNAPYDSVGGELAVNPNAAPTEPAISNSKIFVDGKLTTFMAFNIADNNYIKLRDLGKVFDFNVTWNEETQTIEIITAESYGE